MERPNDDEIRRRAYEIYQSRGGSGGSDMDDWLTAERELREERSAPGAEAGTGAARRSSARSPSTRRSSTRGPSTRGSAARGADTRGTEASDTGASGTEASGTEARRADGGEADARGGARYGPINGPDAEL